MTGPQTTLRALTGADSEEVRPLCWSFLYFFCLLCGYYILRPVRDEMAIEGGVQHLPWMMTATLKAHSEVLMSGTIEPSFCRMTPRMPG